VQRYSSHHGPVLVLILGLWASSCSAAPQTCVFDPLDAPVPNWNGGKPFYVRQTEIALGVSRIEASTAHGLVVVRTWSCDHYGLTANLIVSNPTLSASAIRSEIAWLAEVILQPDDVLAIVNAIEKTGGMLPMDSELAVEDSGYDLFVVSGVVAGELTILSIRIKQS